MKPLFFVLAAVLAAGVWRWRRKLEPTLAAGAALVVIGLLIYGSGLVEMPNIENLIEDAGRTLGKWTYVVVAAAAFLETGAFVGLIAPGETFMVFGGVVAGQGRVDLITVIGIVWAAAVAGDTTSFYLGRRLGRAFLVKHGPKFQITEERLEMVESFFERHGGKTILIGRFVGLVRAIAPFLAGSSGMKFKRFIPYDVIGAGIWASAFVVLGYIFWQSFSTIADYASKGAFALGSVIALIVAIVATVRWLKVPGNREALDAWFDRQFARPALRPLAALLRPVWRLMRGPLRFFVDRITPGELGLEVTTLFAIAGVGLFLFVGPIFTFRDRALTPSDERARELVADIHVSWLADAAKLFTELGALKIVLPAVVLAAIYVAFRRRLAEALTLPIGLALVFAAVNITKPLEDRPRPPGGLVDADGSSFPSGHAAYAVAWVAIALVLTRTFPGFARTTLAVSLACAVVVLVGLSRVYLRVHELSDVTAGAGIAVVMFAICALVALIAGHLRQNGRSQ
ncbi:MAG TPA: bifunctional DedA family/phosphatase PAP2 family protein [Baekduia sp.]|nr:bifunctional DedA family/phosphatase PAP2 family protein [Baekduia sp.]